MKQCLLIIDPQKDFHEAPIVGQTPTQSTAINSGFTQPFVPGLPVPGSNADAVRLANFITAKADALDNIIITMDSHPTHHISLCNWWMTADGKDVAPFTVVKAEEIRQGTIIPKFNPSASLQYIESLTASGEYVHVAWPSHCIIGSEGWSIQPDIFDAVSQWELTTKRNKIVVTKGSYALTEHFGALAAQVPQASVPETQLNQGVLKMLASFDQVFLAGQARTHCVAKTLEQLINSAPDLIKKLVILDDCMSNIPTFEPLAQPIYDKAVALGAIVKKTTDLI